MRLVELVFAASAGSLGAAVFRKHNHGRFHWTQGNVCVCKSEKQNVAECVGATSVFMKKEGKKWLFQLQVPDFLFLLNSLLQLQEPSHNKCLCNSSI